MSFSFFIIVSPYFKIIVFTVLHLYKNLGFTVFQNILLSLTLGGWVKMSAIMVGWRRKILKNTLNIPLSSPRMIQNLTLGNSFSENIISNIQLFKICPQVPVDIIRIFFNFQILQISQTQQKLVKKITHFTTQFRSNNPTHVTNLSSTQLTLKIIC